MQHLRIDLILFTGFSLFSSTKDWIRNNGSTFGICYAESYLQNTSVVVCFVSRITETASREKSCSRRKRANIYLESRMFSLGRPIFCGDRFKAAPNSKIDFIFAVRTKTKDGIYNL